MLEKDPLDYNIQFKQDNWASLNYTQTNHTLSSLSVTDRKPHSDGYSRERGLFSSFSSHSSGLSLSSVSIKLASRMLGTAIQT